MLERQRGDREDGDPRLADQERVLIGPMQAAAVFDDPQSACGDLFADTVIEHDDTVGNIFLQAEACDGPLAAFAGHDGGHTFIL